VSCFQGLSVKPPLGHVDGLCLSYTRRRERGPARRSKVYKEIAVQPEYGMKSHSDCLRFFGIACSLALT
jgi:hypothetical protein